VANEPVRVGQVWKDNDPRISSRDPRLILVVKIYVSINLSFAFCQRCDTKGSPITKRITRIRLDRFRPTSTGYVLVKDVTT
jgi:hypothetical protein